MSRSSFRTLLVAYVMLFLGSAALEWVTESSLPEPLKSYVSAESGGNITGKDLLVFAIGMPFILAELVAVIGLYLFQSWARWLFVVATIVALALMPFSGPFVLSGIAEAGNCIVDLLAGAIMGITIYSPLAGEFRQRQ